MGCTDIDYCIYDICGLWMVLVFFYGYVFMAMCMDEFMDMYLWLCIYGYGYGCVYGHVFMVMYLWLCVWVSGLDSPRGPVRQISGLTSPWSPFPSSLGLTRFSRPI
jgi:hypothetical protein